MRRATLTLLLLVLLALALGRWAVDGVRWAVAPRRRPARMARVPRAATAK